MSMALQYNMCIYIITMSYISDRIATLKSGFNRGIQTLQSFGGKRITPTMLNAAANAELLKDAIEEYNIAEQKTYTDPEVILERRPENATSIIQKMKRNYAQELMDKKKTPQRIENRGLYLIR